MAREHILHNVNPLKCIENCFMAHNNVYFILLNALYALENNMYSDIVGWSTL